MRTDPRRAIHVGALIGVSAVGYAATLAGLATLQSASDGALVTDRAPILNATSEIAEEHDDLDRDVRAARDRYASIVDAYAALEPGIDNLEATLDHLVVAVERVTDSAANLPTRIALPPVRPAPAPAAPPTTHAVTGASGG